MFCSEHSSTFLIMDCKFKSQVFTVELNLTLQDRLQFSATLLLKSKLFYLLCPSHHICVDYTSGSLFFYCNTNVANNTFFIIKKKKKCTLRSTVTS